MCELHYGTDLAAAGINSVVRVFIQQAADRNDCRCTGCLRITVDSEHCCEDIHCPVRIRCYVQAPYFHLCILSHRSFHFIVGDRRGS